MHYNDAISSAGVVLNMADSNDNLRDFEKSLQNLEKIVTQMESGELGLEESLAQFESGIRLAKTCQDTLANAELRVEQLIEKNGLQQTVPFEDLDED
jgi:exodeoxyribonuclease VII small subunit